jgi:histidine triad (HIT) family protein
MKAEVIYEDDAVISFLDIHPRAPGHAVTIPKRHVPNILEMESKEFGPLFRAVRNVTKKLQNALRPDGFTIGVNHGRASGQAVEHLHVHSIPRFIGDGGGSIHTVVHNPPQETLEEIARKIINSK